MFAVLMVAACGEDGGGNTVDAGARADAAPTCPPPGTPLATGTHELYVAFEGVTLTLGACDDATTNCTSLVAADNTVVPPFLMAETGRQTRIANIAALIQESLAPFSIDVVTTRPSSGDYWMVVAGGTAEAVTGDPGALVAAKPVCDATNRKSIALVFEQDSEASDRSYANTIAGAFGSLAGLVPTSNSTVCMCLTTACPHLQQCQWGVGVIAAPGHACDRTTQNEQLHLMGVVGCR